MDYDYAEERYQQYQYDGRDFSQRYSQFQDEMSAQEEIRFKQFASTVGGKEVVRRYNKDFAHYKDLLKQKKLQEEQDKKRAEQEAIRQKQMELAREAQRKENQRIERERQLQRQRETALREQENERMEHERTLKEQERKDNLERESSNQEQNEEVVQRNHSQRNQQEESLRQNEFEERNRHEESSLQSQPVLENESGPSPNEQRDDTPIQWNDLQGKDFNDEEFKQIPLNSKKKMAVANLKMNTQTFAPNILFLQANFKNSELYKISEYPDLLEYTENIGQCAGQNGMSLLVCMMKQNRCNSELVSYCRCLAQYQRSKFLCKVPKLELRHCYRSKLHQMNMLMSDGLM